MAIETVAWNVQDHLNTPEARAAYLEAVFEDNPSADEIAKGLGDVAQAHGISALAAETGLSRQAIYKALGEGGNPTLATLMAVAKAFGLRISLVPIAPAPVGTAEAA